MKINFDDVYKKVFYWINDINLRRIYQRRIKDSKLSVIDLDNDELKILDSILAFEAGTEGTIKIDPRLQTGGGGLLTFRYIAEFVNKNINVDFCVKKSFIKNNIKPQKLNLETKFNVRYLWSHQSELIKNIEDYRGFVSFTRAGYDNQKLEAVIYIDNVRGPLSGDGGIYHLKKEKESWEIMKYYMIWLS
jgi:hypothetical protein